MSETILSVDRETKPEPSIEDIISVESPTESPTNSNENVRTSIDLEFATKIDTYEIALTELPETSSPSHEVILKLLQTRDSLQKIVENEKEKSPDLLLRLLALDKQLKKQGEAIAQTTDLALYRNTFHPSPTRWWWFFEAPKAPLKVDAWDKLDWLWNLLTVLCLTGFVSFSSKIIPLIFADGLGLFESIGLLGPGGMVALVLSSMQGGEGQKKMQQIMNAIGIPSRFQSEVTFAFALILFAGGYAAQSNLPTIYFKNYVAAGKKAYDKSLIREARENYEQALKIDNQDSEEVGKLHRGMGLLSESVGDDDAAQKQYFKALDTGDHAVLNNLGRLRIYKGKLDEAETFLNMGIQRVDPKDIFGQYQLYRNLGWVYLERKNYDKANEYLTKAINFDKEIPKGELGKGIANCLKARVFELQDQPDKAASQWNYCLEFGKPETLHEYEALVKINPQIGTKLDTTGVFQ